MKESSRKQIEYEGIKSGENNKNPIVNIITDEIFIKHENKTNEKKIILKILMKIIKIFIKF